MAMLTRLVAVGALLAGTALAHGAPLPVTPIPGFWPTPASQQRPAYDFWRVWLTRCDVRQKPTSPYNLPERHSAMSMWLGELGRQKLPVNDVAPRQRLAKLSAMIGQRNTAGASAEVDDIFRSLEKMVAGKEYIKGSGKITGKVFLEDGNGAPGVDVVLYGTPLGAITDEEAPSPSKTSPAPHHATSCEPASKASLMASWGA
jgi:hypothetical protein